MTCPVCNDTGCEPVYVFERGNPAAIDWYCGVCSNCDPSQVEPEPQYLDTEPDESYDLPAALLA